MLALLGQSSGTPPAVLQVGRAVGIPKATIFERSAGLGLVPFELCRDVVQFYAATEGLLDAADPEQRDALLAWLLQVANTAPQPLIGLDEFLGQPAQDYSWATVEPVANLPLRNAPPKPTPAAVDDAR